MGGESLNVRDIDFTNYALSSLYTCIIRIVTVNYQGCDWTLELEQYSAALIYVCVWLHKCILVTEWQVRWIFISKFQVVCIMIGEWPDGYFYDEWTGVASWQVAFKVGASQWGLISTVSARTHPSFYLHVYMCVFMYHVCVCVCACVWGWTNKKWLLAVFAQFCSLVWERVQNQIQSKALCDMTLQRKVDKMF